MQAFDLHIDLGNAAMENPAHVAIALTRVIEQLAEMRPPLPTKAEVAIRDENGNTVGGWELTL